MIFELRQYQIQPGKREEWIRFMDEVIIPFQLSKGMVILGSFAEVDTDQYIWIRRFDDEDDRTRLYDAVYQSDHWRETISPQVGNLIDRSQIKVTLMAATPHSFIQ
ncbi:MAG: NIPSNAP family containing protein [Anaerolineaceae bacterium]|nr:NIPSNAP family containing protein [Anaerolineaceae bacterium]